MQARPGATRGAAAAAAARCRLHADGAGVPRADHGTQMFWRLHAPDARLTRPPVSSLSLPPPQKRAMEHPKIEILWNSVVEEAYGNAKGLLGGAKVKNVKTGGRGRRLGPRAQQSGPGGRARVLAVRPRCPVPAPCSHDARQPCPQPHPPTCTPLLRAPRARRGHRPAPGRPLLRHRPRARHRLPGGTGAARRAAPCRAGRAAGRLASLQCMAAGAAR